MIRPLQQVEQRIADQMRRRDRLFAIKVRARAQGRKCGGCIFEHGDHCGLHENLITGTNIETQPNAVACGQWAAK